MATFGIPLPTIDFTRKPVCSAPHAGVPPCRRLGRASRDTRWYLLSANRVNRVRAARCAREQDRGGGCVSDVEGWPGGFGWPCQRRGILGGAVAVFARARKDYSAVFSSRSSVSRSSNASASSTPMSSTFESSKSDVTISGSSCSTTELKSLALSPSLFM